MSEINKLAKAKKILKEDGALKLARKSLNFGVKKTKKRVSVLFPESVRQRLLHQDKEYQFVSNPLFRITESDIKKSDDVIRAYTNIGEIKTANWLVPYFDHLSFGGIYTIFRFIAHLQSQGVQNRIIIYDNPNVETEAMSKEIIKQFPVLQNAEIIVMKNTQDIDLLPASDIAFSTFWVSAYILLKFNKTKRKYYFVQDYEPLFYTAGATYALAESTYRFGFRAIVNTPGLLAAINKRHGQEGISFIPAVNKSVYFPQENKTSKRPVRIFFYARPNNPRNAFELGIEIIKILIQKHGTNIEIITAGSSWEERKYGLGGLVTNLGLIKSIEDVAELYRSCDVGFVYMLTKHPSYQPFEFMASGMATVTNNNEDNVWLLHHGINCLLAEPSPTAMAEQVTRLIEDEKLRKKIIIGGLNSVKNEWSWQTDIIWNDIKQH